MPIKFRCTGCRSKLYVPARWHGTSIVCPRCETRVMVPAVAAEGIVTSFEGAAVEKSLEALVPNGDEPFRAASFTVKVAAPGRSRGNRSRGKRPPKSAGVQRRLTMTLPVWVPYAFGVGLMMVSAGAFLAGIWWASRGGGS
jgi:DNA-directed RNA polymerase subunit RPC12/RpoP